MRRLAFIACCLAIPLLAGCISPELRTARIAVNEQDWNRAINSLEAEIARMPKSAEAYYLKGYCYENLGDWANMTQAYDRSLAVSGQFDGKIKESRTKLLARYFGRAEAAYDSAQTLEKAGETPTDKIKAFYHTALTNLDTGLVIAPNDIRLFRQGAVMGYYGKTYDRAVEFASRAVEMEAPGDKELSVREVLVAVYGYKNDNESVIRWAKELMSAVDPNTETETYLRAFDALVAAYMNLKQPEKAEETTAEAIKLFPERTDIKMNLAILMIQREQIPQAKEIFQQILAQAPDHFEANLNLGTILVNEDKWAEAVPYLEKAQQQQPDNRIAVQNLMAAYYNSGQDKKGAEMKKKMDALSGE